MASKISACAEMIDGAKIPVLPRIHGKLCYTTSAPHKLSHNFYFALDVEAIVALKK